MIDFSQVTDMMLGNTPVEQVSDSQGNVLWSGGYNVHIYAGSNGTVTVNGVQGDFNEKVNSSTVLHIQADGNTDYGFNGWSDGNSDNPRDIIVESDLVLSASFVPNYFCVEDISGSDNTLSITKSASGAPTIEVFASTDTVNWSSMGNTSTTAITATVPANGKLYLKATTNAWNTFSSSGGQNVITAANRHNISGNIMSLLYGDNFMNTTVFPSSNEYVFDNLFNANQKLVSAENLILPATTLTRGCYEGMFRGCRILTTAPAILPATTLANNCYQAMFYYCYALTTAPVLPARTLANYCYNGMFTTCSSLTTAPVLPATTLADYCYVSMFSGCSSLTTAPVLPATTMKKECYKQMFKGCTALTTAPALSARTLNTDCYSNMFDGCTALTTVPALPATTLINGCYSNMFKGCTALTTAPVLPATTLVIGCYRYMFANCSNLNKVTTYASSISASNCLNNWLSGVSATGDFYNLGGATYASGASGIPTGWTEHNSL